MDGPPVVKGPRRPAGAVAGRLVQVEYLLDWRPPLTLGRCRQRLLHRVSQQPPPLCVRVRSNFGLRCGPVVPGVLQVAEKQSIAKEDRVVPHADTSQSGDHTRPDVRMQPPVFDFVLRAQTEDGGYATATRISSVGALGAGVGWAHSSIVASRP